MRVFHIYIWVMELIEGWKGMETWLMGDVAVEEV